MNDEMPSLPDQKQSMTKPWVAWILAATVMPSLSILVMGKNGNDVGGTVAVIILAMVAQLACSIWLAKILAARGGKSGAFVAIVALGLMLASIAIGTASYFAACISLGPALNFH